MRISDWSSDVCSSDLAFGGAGAAGRGAGIILRHPERDRGRARLEIIADRRGDDEELILGRRFDTAKHLAREHDGAEVQRAAVDGPAPSGVDTPEGGSVKRSSLRGDVGCPRSLQTQK